MKIDFTLRHAQKMGGLTIGLAPGEYKPGVTPTETVHLSEKAFFFLEPTLRRRSVHYSRPFAHWGVTPISKEEWGAILEDWRLMRTDLASAQSIDSVPIYADLSTELKHDFNDCFDANRIGLMSALSEIELWLEQILKNHAVICVVGV